MWAQSHGTAALGNWQHYGESAKAEDERKLARHWVMGQAGSLEISEEPWGGVG